jgi:hypothetical protein
MMKLSGWGISERGIFTNGQGTSFEQELPCSGARFYDFIVYGTEKTKEKLDYLHAKPVNRGLLENPCAWIWSSFLSYSGAGFLTIDPVG